MQYLTAKLIAAALIAGVSAPAMAEREGPGRMDADGDGLISQEEFHFPGSRMLEHADQDGDGEVTREEMYAAHEERQAKMAEEIARRHTEMQTRSEQEFAEMDADGNGSVTHDEMKAHAFNRIDSDGDGYVSRKELRKQMSRRGGRRSDEHGRGGPKGHRGRPRGDGPRHGGPWHKDGE